MAENPSKVAVRSDSQSTTSANAERTRTSEEPPTSPINEKKSDDPQTAASDSKPSDIEYPPFRTVLLLMLSLFMAMFLVALDRTIIATAIPVITDHFDSLGDVGWYASAYLLTACCFQLIVGRIYTFYHPKWVFLSCIFIFEVGSAICGAAPSSPVFIVGRAIAGMGGAGIFSGGIVLIVHAVPLHKRPQYTGIMGATFGLASVAGPLLGGVFTNDVSWRWCFYINLPIGAVAWFIIALVINIPVPPTKVQTWREQIRQLDPIGTLFFLPGVVCVLLALQWGGTTYPWSSGRIIALLVLSVILLIAFVAVQVWKQETATVPPRIVKQRSVAAGTWWTLCNGSSMMVVVYFLPIYFQAIKGVSPVKSGIMCIPLVLSLVVSSMGAGFLTRKTGYYTPWMLASAVIMPIGAGLLTTLQVDTGHAKWIGYQVVYGFGLGLGMQQASVGVQTVLDRKDVPTGVSVLFFCQSLGGAVFVSVANNVFDNKLASGLSHIANIDPAVIVRVGATDLRKVLSANLLPTVLVWYNLAVRDAFYVALAMSSVAIFGALAMEWRSVKKNQPGGAPPSGVNGSTNVSSKTEKKIDAADQV